MEETIKRLNMAVELLANQRNAAQNEVVNLHIELTLRNQQIEMLTKQVLELASKAGPQIVVINEPLEEVLAK